MRHETWWKRQETRELRQEKGNRRQHMSYEKGDIRRLIVRQDTWDRRQERWDKRQGTFRKSYGIEYFDKYSSAAHFLDSVNCFLPMWCDGAKIKWRHAVVALMQWRKNVSWNNSAVVHWHKDLKSGACRGGTNYKKWLSPSTGRKLYASKKGILVNSLNEDAALCQSISAY